MGSDLIWHYPEYVRARCVYVRVHCSVRVRCGTSVSATTVTYMHIYSIYIYKYMCNTRC